MAFYWMDMQTFHTHFVVHHTLYIALCISWCKFQCHIHHNKISNIKMQPTPTQLNCNLHLQTSKPYPIHAPWNPRLNTCNIKSHHTSKWNLQILTYRTSNRTKFARTKDQHACVNLNIRHCTPNPNKNIIDCTTNALKIWEDGSEIAHRMWKRNTFHNEVRIDKHMS